ncbi:MAG: isoprenylcysteine carboxylmethyltransferase family protein [Nitrosomonadales bacterium]|nr:isoprenylcysteine carboxylmethyltransferase family protein [Nitrosomonadales bacterium]
MFDYNRLMKLPIILFTLYFLVRETEQLHQFMQYNPPLLSPDYLVSLSARISLILFLLLLVAMQAFRENPVNKAPGLQPRITAVLGLTFSLLLLLLDRAAPLAWLNSLSALLLLVGNYLCIVTLLHLGRSISIMAEARRLVTSGPYALIRHPLYFSEEVAVIGIFLQFRSWEAAVILIIHFALQVQRMRNEEQVLLATFPEYRDYMNKTSRLIPGVW